MQLLTPLVLLIGFIILGIVILRKLDQMSKANSSGDLLEVIRLLQVGSKEDRKILLDSLQANTQQLNMRLDSAAKVISDVSKNVGEMSEIGRSMRDLQDFLKSPKLRGNIGEQVLAELLNQFLPKNSFHLQYSFKSGEKVDAAIETAAGIIPIDSKFPMENFRAMLESNDVESDTHKKAFTRDVKTHIKSISSKYILTGEGTIDYALMYIPSEAVYYEIVNDPNLFDYASDHRILPVSPTTFYAYMRAILMSFEGQKIESQAKEMLAALRSIQKDHEKLGDNLSTLAKHVTNASNMMNTALSSFSSLGDKITSTREIGDASDKQLKD